MLTHELVMIIVYTQPKKVDCASMAVSVAAPVPFADYRVVEFALALLLHLKVRGETGKSIPRRHHGAGIGSFDDRRLVGVH
jgi:asparagine synthetase B (glutamine-hydrolysing)